MSCIGHCENEKYALQVSTFQLVMHLKVPRFRAIGWAKFLCPVRQDTVTFTFTTEFWWSKITKKSRYTDLFSYNNIIWSLNCLNIVGMKATGVWQHVVLLITDTDNLKPLPHGRLNIISTFWNFVRQTLCHVFIQGQTHVSQL